MNGKSKHTITLFLSLLLGLTLIAGGCSSSDQAALQNGQNGGERSNALPPADERGVGTSEAQAGDGARGRVDTPPQDRTDHQNPTALVREQRDSQKDYQRLKESMEKDSASNRGFDQGSRGTKDFGGGGAGDRQASAGKTDRNLALMANRDKSQTMAAPPPRGGTVVVRKRWAKIRRSPKKNSRSVALAYGNDKFLVVKTEGVWVQIRFGRKNRYKGWLLLSDLSK